MGGCRALPINVAMGGTFGERPIRVSEQFEILDTQKLKYRSQAYNGPKRNTGHIRVQKAVPPVGQQGDQ